MTATFPIPHCTILFPNGDTFEVDNEVDHLYNLHLALHEAYPLLPLGEFRLDLVEENEEEERAVFRLILEDTCHLQTDVMLEETGDIWIFDITFSWWLREQEEDGAYDSWSVYVAVDPSNPTTAPFYGQLDDTRTTLVAWHSSLAELLSAYPYGVYSKKTIESIEERIYQLMNEVNRV